jgi:hypothetical protein
MQPRLELARAGKMTQFTYFLFEGMIACCLETCTQDASDRLHTEAVISSLMPLLTSQWSWALYVYGDVTEPAGSM